MIGSSGKLWSIEPLHDWFGCAEIFDENGQAIKPTLIAHIPDPLCYLSPAPLDSQRWTTGKAGGLPSPIRDTSSIRSARPFRSRTHYSVDSICRVHRPPWKGSLKLPS
jgi:hypothetical protein